MAVYFLKKLLFLKAEEGQCGPNRTNDRLESNRHENFGK